MTRKVVLGRRRIGLIQTRKQTRSQDKKDHFSVTMTNKDRLLPRSNVADKDTIFDMPYGNCCICTEPNCYTHISKFKRSNEHSDAICVYVCVLKCV